VWNGFARTDFIFQGVHCILCEPEHAAAQRPWIWRARFFDAWPAVDLALLARGYHLAHIDVADLFGNHVAVERWNTFYELLTGPLKLHRRPVLEGFSRGGLIVYNWAAQNPGRTGCIYGDAPVCDIRSWPGGKGCGPGHAQSWKTCLEAYGLNEENAADYNDGPLFNLKPLADAAIPIVHVCGDADLTVPCVENTAALEARYRELRGTIRVIHKPACGHHPHSLTDPTPVVDFIEARRLHT
jgi:pimeloyl-ACP methyl ester carboxylesterase